MRIFKWVVLNEKKLNKNVEDFVKEEVKNRIGFFVWEFFPFLIIVVTSFFLIKRFK